MTNTFNQAKLTMDESVLKHDLRLTYKDGDLVSVECVVDEVKEALLHSKAPALNTLELALELPLPEDESE